MSMLSDAAGAEEGGKKGERRRGVPPDSTNLGIRRKVL